MKARARCVDDVIASLPGATAAAYWQPAGANNGGRWSAIAHAGEREPDDRAGADERISVSPSATSSLIPFKRALVGRPEFVLHDNPIAGARHLLEPCHVAQPTDTQTPRLTRVMQAAASCTQSSCGIVEPPIQQSIEDDRQMPFEAWVP
jgi:hypothetical protein